MATLNILLCCGAGMSSGFLASNARKVAKKSKEDITIEARSHADVANYLGSIDVLLLGPHYRSELESFKGLASGYGVPVEIIPEDIYTMMDGAALIAFAKKVIAESK